MKHHTHDLTLNLPTSMDFRNITPDVQAATDASGWN
jgi:hypothetical protein